MAEHHNQPLPLRSMVSLRVRRLLTLLAVDFIGEPTNSAPRFASSSCNRAQAISLASLSRSAVTHALDTRASSGSLIKVSPPSRNFAGLLIRKVKQLSMRCSCLHIFTKVGRYSGHRSPGDPKSGPRTFTW